MTTARNGGFSAFSISVIIFIILFYRVFKYSKNSQVFKEGRKKLIAKCMYVIALYTLFTIHNFLFKYALFTFSLCFLCVCTSKMHVVGLDRFV